MKTGISSHSPVRHRPQSSADADAEEGREHDAEDQRLQRRQIGLRQAAVGDQAEKGDERVGEGREGEADRDPAGDLPDRREQHEGQQPQHRRLFQQPGRVAACPTAVPASTASPSLRMLCAIDPAATSCRAWRARGRAGATSQKSSTFSVAGSPSIWPASVKKAKSSAAASAPPPLSGSAAGLGGLLVVRRDLGIGLRAEVGQQLVFVAVFDRDRGVGGDLARGVDQLLDEDVDIGRALGEIVGGGEQALVGGAQILDRQHDELAAAPRPRSARRLAASTIEALIVPCSSALRRTSEPGT